MQRFIIGTRVMRKYQVNTLQELMTAIVIHSLVLFKKTDHYEKRYQLKKNLRAYNLEII